MIGGVLTQRLSVGGLHVCNACQEVIDNMDSMGVTWVMEHRQQLARMINANMRRTGKVPLPIRTRWIQRQIERACNAAMRVAQCDSANAVAQGQHHGTV